MSHSGRFFWGHFEKNNIFGGIVMDIGKVPPHDIEAEQAVIGSMLTDKEAVSSSIEVLKEEDFYKDKEEILKEHHTYLNNRLEKLPLEYPNLGSIFKNPLDNHAGKMIDDIGIKGLEFNGAKISDKHANVIVNSNDAKGESILKLIEIIEDLVYIKYKIKLEREIIIFK